MKLLQSQLSSNPVFVSLAGRNRWIPPPIVFFLAFAAEITIAFLLAQREFRSPIPGFPLVQAMLAGWLLVLLVPAIIAMVTTEFVARDARSEEYQLLTLTSISATSRLYGYIAGSLFRMRHCLILFAGLLPLLAEGMIAVSPFVRQAIFYLLYCPPNDVRCSPYIHMETPLSVILVEAVLLPLMIWELILLAATSGVLFGLKWRHNPLARSLISLSILLATLAVTRLWHVTRWRSWSSGLPLAHMAICLGLSVLVFAIAHFARRWA